MAARPNAAVWKRYIPNTAAAVLTALIAADIARFALDIRRSGLATATTRSVPSLRARGATLGREIDVERIISAHLFGAAAGRTAIAQQGAVSERVDLALSGVIATTNPRDGYAILGKKSGPPQLFHTGTALSGLIGAKLYQVFADRVVLDFGDRYESVRLPRTWGAGAANAIVAAAPGRPDKSAASTMETPLQPATEAETLFGSLYAEEDFANGKLSGMRVHPAKYFQRLYGIKDGDVVTAVNGVEITSRDVLAHSLKDSGDSLSLTVMHDGVEQTVSLSAQN